MTWNEIVATMESAELSEEAAHVRRLVNATAEFTNVYQNNGGSVSFFRLIAKLVQVYLSLAEVEK